MKTKKVIGIIAIFTMIFSLMPQCMVSATEYYVDHSWDEANKKIIETLKEIPTSAEEITADTTTLNSGWYIAENTINLEAISINGDVKLILKNGCVLNSNGGLKVGRNSSLTIYAQSEDSNMGKIIATGSNNSAGIGGDSNRLLQDTMNVTIHGGDLTATGHYGGAGIGAGRGCNNCTIMIYGGKINANGGAAYGAGIGGGSGSTNCKVTIYDGDITAIGGNNDGGAGIGGGYNGDCGIVEIYGGKISATGGKKASAIGRSKMISKTDGSVSIYDGIIDAIGGNDGNGGKCDAILSSTIKVIPNDEVWMNTIGETSLEGSPFTTETNITSLLADQKQIHTHKFTGEYRNNGDETHSQKCAYCDVYGKTEEHNFEKHICACGAEDISETSEFMPYSRNNYNVSDLTYSYEGVKFNLTSQDEYHTNGSGICGGTDENWIKIESKDPTIKIDYIKANLVSWSGTISYVSLCDSIGVSSGRIIKDYSNNTITFADIDASTFSLAGGNNFGVFSDMTVYYYDFNHDVNGDCIDNKNGTHTYICSECGKVAKTEPHTFENYYCTGCHAEDVAKAISDAEKELMKYSTNCSAEIEVAAVLNIQNATTFEEVKNLLEQALDDMYATHDFSADCIYNGDGTYSIKCKNCSIYSKPQVHNFNHNIHCFDCDAELYEELKYPDKWHIDQYFEQNELHYNNNDGKLFNVYADKGSVNGIQGGLGGHKLEITSKNPDITIDHIEATLVDRGEYYGSIPISSGYKVEDGPVENGTIVHINDINSDVFTINNPNHFSDVGYCVFKDITVYYIVHDYTGEYKDNGDNTHSQKCTVCDRWGAPEKHTFVNHVCVCGAKDDNALSLNLDDWDFKVNVQGKDADTGIVMVALYDSKDTNRLINVKLFDLEKGEKPQGTFYQMGYFKAFWWKDFKTMIPLCNAVESN